MKNTKNGSSVVLQQNEVKKVTSGYNEIAKAFAELEQGIHAALETYSNVHRGSGHNSIVTTYLFEQARDIILEYLGMSQGKYSKMSYLRSGLSVPGYWVRPWLQMILSSLPIPPKPSTWQPKF